MVQVSEVHTADLSRNDLAEIRRLLDNAFDGDFADEDWEHTLGGLHFLTHHDGELVGHNAVVQRRLVHQDRSIRVGYVEGLAVWQGFRGYGHASALMTAAERVLTRGYDLGALSDGTGIDGFYQRRGWLSWHGPTWVLATDGLRRTPDDDGSVLVFRTPTSPDLDVDGDIACDWRPGDAW